MQVPLLYIVKYFHIFHSSHFLSWFIPFFVLACPTFFLTILNHPIFDLTCHISILTYLIFSWLVQFCLDLSWIIPLSFWLFPLSSWLVPFFVLIHHSFVLIRPIFYLALSHFCLDSSHFDLNLNHFLSKLIPFSFWLVLFSFWLDPFTYDSSFKESLSSQYWFCFIFSIYFVKFLFFFFFILSNKYLCDTLPLPITFFKFLNFPFNLI